MRKSLCVLLIISLLITFQPVVLNYADTSWAFPVDNYYVSGYDFPGPVSYTDGRFWHLGEDARASAGTNIKAASEGKIMFSGYAGSFGYVVIMEHPEGVCSLYGHLAKDGRLPAGTTNVAKGTVIGKSGAFSENGGWSEHLHWGIHTGNYGGAVGSWPSWVKGRESASLPMPSGWLDPSDKVKSNLSVNPTTNGSFTVQYYNNEFLQGNAVFTENKSDINGNWGAGSPNSKVNSDSFSARYTGTVNFEQGYYSFNYNADDGIKVIIDDSNTLINNNGPGAVGNAGLNLTSGNHKIVVEYTERTGNASVQLTWTKSAPTITVPQLPDLATTSLTHNSNDIVVGKQIYFDSGVVNNGSSNSGNFSIKWFINGNQVGIGSHVNVPANSTVLNDNSGYTWTPQTAGVYTIKFVVDADQQITESNENNNETSITINVKQAALTGLATKEGSISVGAEQDLFQFIPKTTGSYTIRSNGNLDTIGYLFDSNMNKLSENDDSGGLQQFLIKQDLTAGLTYYVKVKAYSSSITGNYTLEVSGPSPSVVITTANDQTTSPAIDLMPTSIVYNRSDLKVGQMIFIDSAVKNNGKDNSGNFSIKWYVNGVEVGYGLHGNVTGNSTIQTDNSGYYWTPLTAGTYTVKFVLDPDNRIMESNEINNETSITIVVPSVESTISGNVKGKISIAGEPNLYKFTANASGYHSIKSTGTFDVYGYLYDSNMRNIANNDDAAGNRQFLMTVNLTAGQTYYIEVKSFNASLVGEYGLEVSGSIQPVTLTAVTAETALAKITMKGNIASPNETDLYRIVPSITGSHTITSAGTFDVYGYLYSSNMTLLAQNDDGAGNQQFSITFDLIAGDTYYVKVKSYNPSLTGLYDLVLTGLPTAPKVFAE